MARWTVAAPTALDFDDVTQLNVRLIGGTVAVLASDDQPGLAVTELTGRPLQVSHEAGVLTVSYESLTWEGLLGLLKPRKDNATITITVPAECPIQLGVLSASAVVTGLHAGAAVKGMSGDITLDGVTGLISAETMSGEMAACDLDGEIHFKSMSGGLTLAGGSVDTLTVDTMSGQVTADVALSGSCAIAQAQALAAVARPRPSSQDRCSRNFAHCVSASSRHSRATISAAARSPLPSARSIASMKQSDSPSVGGMVSGSSRRASFAARFSASACAARQSRRKPKSRAHSTAFA